MMFLNTIRRFLPAALLLLMLILPASAQSGDTHVRFGHFALDTGAVDVYLDGTLLLEGQKLADVSDWRTIPAGAHSIIITLQGVSIDTPLLTPAPSVFNGGDWITLALIGRRAPGTLRLQSLLENYSPIKAGETRLSVFHAFYPNPPINVRVNDTDLIIGLAYPGTIGANDGLETVNLVARTRYDFELSLMDGTAIRTVPIAMGEKRHYFLALTGTIDNPITVVVATDLEPAPTSTPTDVPTATPVPATDVPATDAAPTDVPATETIPPVELPIEVTPLAGTPMPAVTDTPAPTAIPVRAGQTLMRVGNFSPGAPDFSIYLNGQQIIPFLAYPTLSDYLPVDAGTYEMEIVVEGESVDSAILRKSITIPAGGVMTMMAIGSLDTGTFQLQPVEEDYSPLRPGLARIAIFHAVPDAPFLNLLANDKLLVERLIFPGTFEGGGDGFFSVDVLASDYQLSVELNDDRTVNLGKLRLGDGRYYFVVIAGTTDTAFFVLKSSTIKDIRP